MLLKQALSEGAKFVPLSGYTAAGTSDVVGSSIDTNDYNGCLIFAYFGTAATNNTIKIQGSSDDGAVDTYADLAGTSLSSGASNELVIADIPFPRSGCRYLKPTVARGTSSTLIGIFAVLYNPRTLPVSNAVTGTSAVEVNPSPAEGTA